MLAAMTNNQNFNDLDPEQQAAIAQAIQHQQQQMYQVDQNGVEEEDEGEDEVDIEYDGIEGMEQQIEDDGELMQNQGEDDMMDDEEDDDNQGEQMMGDDVEDDMFPNEIDPEQLQQLLMQNQLQNQMAI